MVESTHGRGYTYGRKYIIWWKILMIKSTYGKGYT